MPNAPGDKETDPTVGAEPFSLEITDVLDLHTFRPSEVGEAVETYLEEARQRGIATVRIIHGKGIGVQRERVRAVLSRTPFVVQFQDAPMGAGSWGATIAWLRQGPETESR
jgi:dsDNA-specific endonuclease/ATPase MutS2